MKLLNISRSAVAAIIVAGLSSHAASATGLSAPSTASADITFAEPYSITNTLTPVAGLAASALSKDTVLANGTLTSTGTVNKHYISLGTPAMLLGSGYVTVLGNNSSANSISIKLVTSNPAGGQHGSTACSSLGLTCDSGSRLIFWSAPDSHVTNYTLKLASDQEVKADTYTVQTTAYAYVN